MHSRADPSIMLNIIWHCEPELTPKRASRGAAGFDFRAAKDVIIPPYWWQLFRGYVKPTLVSTGVRWCVKSETETDEDVPCVLLLRDRSSIAMTGLRVEAGVIDADYRGDIKFAFMNFGLGWRHLSVGERIGQGLILPTPTESEYTFDTIESLPSNTIRGEGGFGSTGK